jgi:hypothetical protein
VLGLISAEQREGGLERVLTALLAASRSIGVGLREGQFSADRVGTSNVFGDEQLDVDVKTDAIMFAQVRFTSLCCTSQRHAHAHAHTHTVTHGDTPAHNPLTCTHALALHLTTSKPQQLFSRTTQLNQVGNVCVSPALPTLTLPPTLPS